MRSVLFYRRVDYEGGRDSWLVRNGGEMPRLVAALWGGRRRVAVAGAGTLGVEDDRVHVLFRIYVDVLCVLPFVVDPWRYFLVKFFNDPNVCCVVAGVGVFESFGLWVLCGILL